MASHPIHTIFVHLVVCTETLRRLLDAHSSIETLDIAAQNHEAWPALPARERPKRDATISRSDRRSEPPRMSRDLAFRGADRPISRRGLGVEISDANVWL